MTTSENIAASVTESLVVRGGLAPWQVRRAKQIMSENLTGWVALEEVAQACRLSKSHFGRAFKATTGRSPHRWLLEYRVEHAKRLLTDSDDTLADIASRCGFADQSHFAKVFCRLVGVPPRPWRRAQEPACSEPPTPDPAENKIGALLS
jgi:AraC-like DNA-binding protein